MTYRLKSLIATGCLSFAGGAILSFALGIRAGVQMSSDNARALLSGSETIGGSSGMAGGFDEISPSELRESFGYAIERELEISACGVQLLRDNYCNLILVSEAVDLSGVELYELYGSFLVSDLQRKRHFEIANVNRWPLYDGDANLKSFVVTYTYAHTPSVPKDQITEVHFVDEKTSRWWRIIAGWRIPGGWASDLPVQRP